jgi:hypothetical protein
MDTFPCLEVGRKSRRCLRYFGNWSRFFTRNILPKTMSFEPPTGILRSSGVIGAIKNNGDRLGDIFDIQKSGSR